MFSSRSIVSRAWMAFSIIGVMLAASILGNYISGRKLDQVTERLFSRVDRYHQLALEFKLNVIQVQQWLTDISATRGQDGLNDGFDMAEKHYIEAQKDIAELAALVPEEEGSFEKMKTALKKFYDTGKKMAELYVTGGPAKGNPFMADFDETTETLSKAVDGLTGRAEINKREMAVQLQETVHTSNRLALGASLFMMCLLGGGMFAFARVLAPLHGLREVAVSIAGNDLSGDVPDVKGQHEIAMLAQAFRAMKVNVSKAISQISESSISVNQASDNMHRIADDTHQTLSNQQVEIEHIATAINEMATTVQEISRNTAAAADSAAQADDAVVNGHQVVERTASATQSLAEEISRSSEVVANLRSDSEAIGGVLDVIRGIAEQTNLLALNAAIEAARAGEQGRGFAVVADEVRTLASRTQQSTAEIQDMIERLQQGTEQAVHAMEQSRTHAGETAILANEAGQTLSVINTAVNQIRSMSMQIATAAEEQGLVADEINRNVTGIHEMSELTAETARQTTDSSKVLSGQADRLRQVVEQFKLQA